VILEYIAERSCLSSWVSGLVHVIPTDTRKASPVHTSTPSVRRGLPGLWKHVMTEWHYRSSLLCNTYCKIIPSPSPSPG